MKVGYRILTEYTVYDEVALVRGSKLEHIDISDIYDYEVNDGDIITERENLKAVLKFDFKEKYDRVSIGDSWVRKVFYDESNLENE